MAEFLSLNDLRHSLQLRAAEYYLDENLTKLAGPEENFDMFQKFSLFDNRILNQENLIKLVNANDSTRGPTAILNADISNELKFTHNGLILPMVDLIGFTNNCFFIFTLIVTLGAQYQPSFYLLPITPYLYWH